MIYFVAHYYFYSFNGSTIASVKYLYTDAIFVCFCILTDVNNEKITKKNEKSSKKSLKLDNSIGQVKYSKDKGMNILLLSQHLGCVILYIFKFVIMLGFTILGVLIGWSSFRNIFNRHCG